MNLTGKYSSTDYQTTNYGLGGLCERHLDPHGYLEGAHLPPFLKGLKQSGILPGFVIAHFPTLTNLLSSFNRSTDFS